MTDTTQRQHRIESKDEASDCVKVGLGNAGSGDILDQPFGLSLPTNPDFNEFLASRSAELTNRHLVTRVVQCAAVSESTYNQLIYALHSTRAQDRTADPLLLGSRI